MRFRRSSVVAIRCLSAGPHIDVASQRTQTVIYGLGSLGSYVDMWSAKISTTNSNFNDKLSAGISTTNYFSTTNSRTKNHRQQTIFQRQTPARAHKTIGNKLPKRPLSNPSVTTISLNGPHPALSSFFWEVGIFLCRVFRPVFVLGGG